MIRTFRPNAIAADSAHFQVIEIGKRSGGLEKFDQINALTSDQ